MDIKKDIIQEGDKEHQDSFWYEGHIATLSMMDRDGNTRNVYIYAVGDIRIYNKEGELVYDVKARNSGFPEFSKGLQTDKDLAKLEKYGYTWENNNWFSFDYNINNEGKQNFLGDCCYMYDEAIKKGIKALKDEKFWRQFKERG